MTAATSLRAAMAAIATAGALGTLAMPAAGAQSSRRTVLAGTAAPATAQAQAVGAVGSTTPITFVLALKWHRARQAAELARVISTPGTSQYRQYLTAAQWKARFAPTASEVAAARAWLRRQGFTVGAVSSGSPLVTASGTAAQIDRAFQTSLGRFRVRGHVVRQATRNLSIPASLAGYVAGVVGINQRLAQPAQVTDPPPPAAFVTSGPCSAYYADDLTALSPPFGHGYPATVPDVVCGYTPAQMRSAYGVTSAATGKRVTVAVVDAYDSATQPADANRYFATEDPSNPFSAARLRKIDEVPYTDEAACGASGWQTEEAIDIEAVHATAPNAHIVYVGAASCDDPDLLTAEATVVLYHLADVVTNSWGDPAGDVLDDDATKAAYDNLFQMAAATGMTVQFSSGDDGDNFDVTGISAPSYPPSSPWVTAVGGTTTKINAAGRRYQDLGWATGRSYLCTTNLVGVASGCTARTRNTWLPATEDGVSGGYTSYTYAQPPYQAGVVPASLSERNAPVFGAVPARVVPDISADADPGTGFLIGLTETFNNGQVAYATTRYGGTSLASPLLAGVVADADQQVGRPVGFINPALYRLARTHSPAIYDVLPEATRQGNYRRDYANQVFATTTPGFAQSFRELYFRGQETYCDATNNCASRRQPLTAARGYDGLTGLGSPGSGFIGTLARTR